MPGRTVLRVTGRRASIVKHNQRSEEHAQGASENTGEGTARPNPGRGKTGCRSLRVAQAPEQMSRGERRNPKLKNPILL
jgi:hypothetical protein